MTMFCMHTLTAAMAAGLFVAVCCISDADTEKQAAYTALESAGILSLMLLGLRRAFMMFGPVSALVVLGVLVWLVYLAIKG